MPEVYCIECRSKTAGRSPSGRCRACAQAAAADSRKRQPVLGLPDDPAVLGYIAGLLDGEGNITIRRPPARSVQITIANSYEPLMQWLTTFGGAVYRTVRLPPRVPIYHWQINSRASVLVLLDAVLPYLTVKHAKATAAVAVLRHGHETREVA